MKKGLLILIGLLFVTSFTSCKKEEKVAEPTKEELLQKHIWKGVEAVAYDASGNETGRQAIPQFEMLFAVNNDYFLYDSGDLDGYGDWIYVKGDPDIIKLTPSSSRPAPSILKVGDINFRSPLQTMDLKVDKLTENDFVFYIEDGSNKIVYTLKK
jgi:hypothetical protein